MKLKTYLESNNIPERVFSDLIGVTLVSVNRYIKGTRIPDRVVMQRIAQVTGGKVMPNDFFNIAEQTPEKGSAA